MSNKPVKKVSTKSSDRAQLQRERILDAAEQCFIEQGFHVASMSSICDVAGMSAGLIYRYFENKNAITLAIIERQLLRMRTDFTGAREVKNFTSLFRDILSHWKNGHEGSLSPVLFLEMVAYATRDEQIKQALANNERTFSNAIMDWLQSVSDGAGLNLSPAQIRLYDFSLKCFIEGLAVRVVREPDLDLEFVLASAELMFANLLPADS